MTRSLSKVVLHAIESTEAYLQLLDSQDLGREKSDLSLVPGSKPEYRPVAGVLQICGHYSARPRMRLMPGDAIIYLDPRAPTKIEARVVAYDRRAGDLLLAFSLEKLPGSGQIEVDMRWLVRQQLQWLQERGGTVKTPFRPEVEAKLLGESATAGFLRRTQPECTQSQREAIRTAVSHAVTYVWGPPGTGKTTKVLSELLRGFIRDGKRILLVGPTNTALDNALLAVLPTLSPQERMWTARLGIASPGLLAQYPDVCEDGAIQRELLGLLGELEGIEGELDSVVRVGTLRRQIDECNATRPAILKQSEAHSATVRVEGSRQPALLANVIATRKSLASCETELARAEREKAGIGFWARAFTSQHATASDEVTRWKRRVEGARQDQREADIEYGRHALALSQATREADRLVDQLRALDSQRDARVASLESDPFIRKDLDVGQLRDLHRSLSGKRNMLLERKKTLSLSIEDKRVIATTLDTFVSRFRQAGLRVDWVILDEAGFTPLIKALCLLSLGCPITLLGDHKQLEPIAEVGNNDKLIVQFWMRSAVHLDEILSSDEGGDSEFAYDTEEDEREAWLTTEVPFRKVKKVCLLDSFRFSHHLASILDHHVYKMQLQGRAPHPTRIFSLEVTAQADSAGTRRVNLGEVNAVADLVQRQGSNDPDQTVILTPYKKQAAAIQRLLAQRGRSDIEVLNVHKSQGREWDTVVFSVVDGSLPRCQPWFTSSLRPVGVITLNSALSRVRKNLVIVCEGSYWTNRSGEMLSDLLAVATPWSG